MAAPSTGIPHQAGSREDFKFLLSENPNTASQVWNDFLNADAVDSGKLADGMMAYLPSEPVSGVGFGGVHVVDPELPDDLENTAEPVTADSLQLNFRDSVTGRDIELSLKGSQYKARTK
ncbi:hypothetical protein HDU93_003632, partial [Gonapodya sp. JEL0774]